MSTYVIVLNNAGEVNDFVARSAASFPESFEIITVEGLLSTPGGLTTERYIVLYDAPEPLS